MKIIYEDQVEVRIYLKNDGSYQCSVVPSYEDNPHCTLDMPSDSTRKDIAQQTCLAYAEYLELDMEDYQNE